MYSIFQVLLKLHLITEGVPQSSILGPFTFLSLHLFRKLIQHFKPLKPLMQVWPHLVQLVFGEGGRGVVEVQHGGRRLDDVPATLWAAEAVVSGQIEVLIAAAAIRQLKHLTGNHRLLLGHTERRREEEIWKETV